MRQNQSQRHHVATGGKENPLKVWDLEKPDKPIFTAKNVRQKSITFSTPSILQLIQQAVPFFMNPSGSP